MTRAEVLAAVLAEHVAVLRAGRIKGWTIPVSCECGWVARGGSWAEHVAAALNAALAAQECERANLAHACNECGRDVPEDDAGPSCGAHILHIDCGPWFCCDHCYLVRAEIP